MQALLKNTASWLKPEGLLFVHIFTHKSLAYHFEVCCSPAKVYLGLLRADMQGTRPCSSTAALVQGNTV